MKSPWERAHPARKLAKLARKMRALPLLLVLATPAAAGDYWKDNNCVRSDPVPELAASMVKDHSFTIDRAKGEATETAAVLGIPVKIMHSGCENLTWVITAPRQTGEDELDLYTQAYRVLDLLPFDPAGTNTRYPAMNAIARYQELMEDPEPGKVLVADRGGIRTTVEVVEISEGGKRFVQIGVSLGPL